VEGFQISDDGASLESLGELGSYHLLSSSPRTVGVADYYSPRSFLEWIRFYHAF